MKLKSTGALSFSGCVGSVVAKSMLQMLQEEIMNWIVVCQLLHEI